MAFDSLFGRSKKQLNFPRAAKRNRLNLEPLEERRVLAAYINEIYFDPPGSGGDLRYEYVELRGTPSMSLDDYYLILLENENDALNTGNPGMVEFIFDLSGESFGSNGFLTLRQQSTPYTVAPGTTDLFDTGTDDGWDSTLNIQSEIDTGTGLPGNKIENSGFTAMLIHNAGGATFAPTIGQDLDQGNDGLDDASSDVNDWNDHWTILDSIGIHSEFGESQYGRLYAPINFGPDGPSNVESGATYVAVGYEIEFIARYGNSTGQTPADWHVSNLTDNVLAGYTGNGDFRQSGDPQGSPTFVETNQGVPYGTNLTNTLGAPNYPGVPNSNVEARHIFYNQSTFDGNSAAINASDNAAIAPDKTPLLANGVQAVLANITSYTRGINGIIIDLSTGVDHTGLTLANVANNFIFKVGANNSPALWTPAPAPSALSMTAGGGLSGADRVTITWADNAIANKYLEVGILPTAQTGLAASANMVDPDGAGGAAAVAVGDVFFWGHLMGETAATTPAGAFARTVAADRGPILANGTQASVGITNRLDINKSNSITVAADGGPILAGGTGSLTRISIGTVGPYAPEGDGDAGITSALASTASPSLVDPQSVTLSITARMDDIPRARDASVASYFGQPSDEADYESTKDAQADFSTFEFDDELIQALVRRL
ncbi:MAG: hypothetical protein WD845_17735 [Pirellulales bacterium]